MMHKRASAAVGLSAFLLSIAASLSAADFTMDLSRSIDWAGDVLTVSTMLDLRSAGLKMPTGRSQAEMFADMEFPRLVRPSILALPVDSSSTVESLIRSGSLSEADIGGAAAGARRSASILSTDLSTLTTTYRIDTKELRGVLVRHRQAAAAPKVLDPRPTGAYTGIVIIADERLPVHGTRSESYAAACFFPKIWDTEMNLIYERNMTDPETARERGIVRYGSKAEDPAFAALVGRNPLYVLARGLFGSLPTDPIIDRDDALKIISSAENKTLLKEGRVAIVLAESALRELR